MKVLSIVLCLSSIAASGLAPARVVAAEVDARPPDRLTLSASGSKQIDVANGGGGSLNWLHYFTPDAIFGVGAEHQFIADARLTFGSLRGSWSRGEPASKLSIFGEVNYGKVDDGRNKSDYSVAALGLSQALTTKFYVELESRQIDIDTTHGNLPKLGLTYVWSPRLLTYLSYAHSAGGNLGTELTTARLEYYGQHANLKVGGASGRAAVVVVCSTCGTNAVGLPPVDSKQGFIGVGKTFQRGEVQLLGDYLKTDVIKKVTLTLSFTAYLGSRGRAG